MPDDLNPVARLDLLEAQSAVVTEAFQRAWAIASCGLVDVLREANALAEEDTVPWSVVDRIAQAATFALIESMDGLEPLFRESGADGA